MRAITVWAKKESDSTWLEIVPLQGESFNLSKKLIDLENIEAMRCDVSKTLYFPAENSLNDAFFSNFANLNTAHTFNPFDFYECKVLTTSGAQLLIGALYLVEYDQRKKLYQCNIASKVGTIKQRLGDATLEALTQYNHPFSWDNIKSSWATNTGWQQKIKYMPIDNGVGVGDVVNITTTSYPCSQLFYPGVNIKEAVKDTFGYLGFPFADLSNSPSNVFMAMGGSGDLEKIAPPITVDAIIYNFSVNGDENGTDPIIRTLYLSPSPGTSIGHYPHTFGTDTYYEVLELVTTATYEFSNNFSILNNTGNPITIDLSFYYGDRVDDVTVRPYVRTVTVPHSDSLQNIVFPTELFELKKGQFIRTVLEIDAFTPVPSKEFALLDNLDPNFPDLNYISLKGFINVNAYLKRVKLYDIILLYRKLYDVYFVFNQSLNRFEAHNYSTLISGGASVDWTNKIEYKTEFKSGSLINFIASKYSYLVKKSKNLIDFITFNKDGIPLGAFQFFLPVNSQQAEQKTDVITSTWVNSNDGGYLFYKNYEVISEPKANEMPLVIAFFVENKSVATYIVKDESNSEQYGFTMGRFENTNNGLILAFNRIDQYAGNADNSTSVSLFKAFHLDKFSEWIGLEFTDGVGATLNNADLINARIITTQVWLTQAEFSAITLGERVTINTPIGSEDFRILEISNYNATGNSPCNVKLIRIQ